MGPNPLYSGPSSQNSVSYQNSGKVAEPSISWVYSYNHINAVNNEDCIGEWGLVCSRVMWQTHVHLDSYKGAFIIDIDQQLSDRVRQKNFLPFPSPLVFHCLACQVTCSVLGQFPFIIPLPPPPIPGHHAQDMKGYEEWDLRSNTPNKHLHPAVVKYSRVQFCVLQSKSDVISLLSRW